MGKGAWVIFPEDAACTHRKWWVHVHEIATLGMFQDLLKVAIEEAGGLQPTRTSQEEFGLGKISAPVAAVWDVEFAPQVRAVDAVEAEAVEVDKPRRSGSRGH